MQFNEYQKNAVSLAIYGAGNKIIYPTLGLVGEAGEVADKIKKVLRDNNGNFTDAIKFEIIKELGDVLWYIAALAEDLDYDLEAVATANLDKLNSRTERDVIHGEGDNR